MSIVETTTHVVDAVARPPKWLKDATELAKLVSIFPERVQELETVLFDLLDERSIGTATSAQLDIIGKHVGEPRLGRTDAAYDAAIAVRILINTSIGNKARLREIAKTWTAADRVTFADAFPAALLLTIHGGSIDDTARFVSAMNDAKAGGVNLAIIAAFATISFAVSELIVSASDGATTDSDTFTVTHSLADVLEGDKLLIYGPDTDAGEYNIETVGASTIDVTPATLTAPRSGISYDIRRHTDNTDGFGTFQSSGSNGATVASDVFNSAGATFIADGATATSKIFVIGFGLFDIDSVPLETQIKSTALLAAVGAGASSLDYIIVDDASAGILASLVN